MTNLVLASFTILPAENDKDLNNKLVKVSTRRQMCFTTMYWSYGAEKTMEIQLRPKHEEHVFTKTDLSLLVKSCLSPAGIFHRSVVDCRI